MPFIIKKEKRNAYIYIYIYMGAFLRYWAKTFYRGREVGSGSLRRSPLESICAQDQTLQAKRNIYIHICMYIVIAE